MASKVLFSWMTLVTVSLAIFFLLVWPANGAAVSRVQRDAEEAKPEKKPTVSYCKETTPCGWAVYTPFTRRIDYFMRNACTCPVNKECVRSSDDLSVSAYVYHCVPEKIKTINSTS